LGGWLFRHRTWLPVPIALVLLFAPSDGRASPASWLIGVVLVATGELVRLQAVRQIGVISRTRSERLGPLVTTGPFARVRNPLYLGNIAIWLGFAVGAGLSWLAAPLAVMLALGYHAIVRWEEWLLESRHGDDYRAYARQVPQWLPQLGRRPRSAAAPQPGRFGWRETLFSERGTLIAIAAGYLLLWAKTGR
jgi:protein-S-isoprenylcysteine O-methyltransferase Ste14